jgi:hypothetical protein
MQTVDSEKKAAQEIKAANKETYEVEKLQLEIQLLRRPWWKKSEYLAFIAPTAIAFLSLFIVLQSNMFQSQNAFLEAKKLNLQTQISQLETLKKVIERELDESTKMLEEMKIDNQRQKQYLDSTRKINEAFFKKHARCT